jgi:hypothetical protein
MRSVFPAHLILNFMNVTIFGEKCKLWSSSVADSLQVPVISGLLRPNAFLTVLFSSSRSVIYPY